MPHDTLPQGCVTVWQWQKMWHNVSSVTQVADVTDVTQVSSVTEVTSVRSCSLVRSVLFGSCNPQAIMLTHLRWLDPATPRKYQSRHKCPKGVLKICEQAPIFNLALCTYGVRPLLRSAQSQRSFACSLSLKRTLILHIGKAARAVVVGYHAL